MSSHRKPDDGGEGMNIHDKARQMVAQNPLPMELREAYRRMGRRSADKRKPRAPVDMSKVRLPYADN